MPLSPVNPWTDLVTLLTQDQQALAACQEAHQARRLQSRIKEASARLAADPRTWDRLACWQIVAFGYWPEPAAYHQALRDGRYDPQDPLALAHDLVGSLPHCVKAAFTRRGFPLATTALSGVGWSVAASPLLDRDAFTLCACLHADFSDELRTRQLVLERRYDQFSLIPQAH